MPKILLFITNTYPCGGITESSFITPEIQYLKSKFDKVIFVPSEIDGDTMLNDGNGLFTDVSYATVTDRYSKSRKILFAIKRCIGFAFIKSLLFDPKILFDRYKLTAHIMNYYQAKKFKWWFMKNYASSNDEVTIYLFWFLSEALGYSLLPKRIRCKIKCVSRAHGYDVYDERVGYRSWYLRNRSLKYIDSVFCASKAGCQYLQNKFTDYSDKIKISYLGSLKRAQMMNPLRKNNKQITFFSSARMHPVKRVPLIAECLKQLAEVIPETKINWVHVGDGEEFNLVKKVISEKTDNFSVELLGAKPNGYVHDIYVKRHIDWCILCSSSEGFPIALCEALSYGVPVVATAVGGIPEFITDGENGLLLDRHLTPQIFIEKVIPTITDESEVDNMREWAYLTWAKFLDATKNRKIFVEELSY